MPAMLTIASTLLTIASTWDGHPIPARERAEVRLAVRQSTLEIDVDAPSHGDPPPLAPPGSTDRLWEHEVVELFLIGADQRYLEIELGPHGHYLVLQLHGVRNVSRRGLRIDYRAKIAGGRWRGQAKVPLDYLPPAIERANAFTIHGRPPDRRYLAASPVPGSRPDFHRIQSFPPIVWPPAIDPPESGDP